MNVQVKPQKSQCQVKCGKFDCIASPNLKDQVGQIGEGKNVFDEKTLNNKRGFLGKATERKRCMYGSSKS
jgi:hypothetical protein